MFKYATVCSGIEAPSTAWHELGWEPVFFSEIEKFPNALLTHHWPDVPNYGDLLNYKDWPDDEEIDLICGGTPCQSFSIAGLRQGLDDPRGNLALTFIGLVDKYRPNWVIWENVPGVLSSATHEPPAPGVPQDEMAAEGQQVETQDDYQTQEVRDFYCFLAGMQEIGYFGAWRVLDAQWFGVAQRRRRVFAVFCPGDWRGAAAVLFESESLCGDSPPRRETQTEVAGTLEARAATGGYDPGAHGAASGHLIPAVFQPRYARNGRGAPDTVAGPLTAQAGQTGKGDSAQCVFSMMPMNSGKDFKAREVEVTQPIMAAGQTHGNQGGDVVMTVSGDITHTLRARGFDASEDGTERGTPIASGDFYGVRRLTPVECERLQGFPDNFTCIPWRGKSSDKCPDGPRYKALGNSMAVPVIKWLGERIAMFEDIKYLL